jgi:hypothetical protein
MVQAIVDKVRGYVLRYSIAVHGAKPPGARMIVPRTLSTQELT